SPNPNLRPGKAPLKEFERLMKKWIRDSRSQGREPWCLWDGKTLRAVIRRDHYFGKLIGLKQSESFAIGVRPNDLFAKQWIVEKIRHELSRRPNWSFELYIPAHQKYFLKKLQEMGM